MRWAVVAPRDSAFEADLLHVLSVVLQHRAVAVQAPADLEGADCVVLTGDPAWREALVGEAGRESSLAHAIVGRARQGGLTLGIGEGFAALCALGILPGALAANEPDDFVCTMAALRVENAANPWAVRGVVGDVWRMPLRTAAARYRAEEAELERLERDGQVLLRYVASPGDRGGNPVGADRDIAAVMNPGRHALGIAVHPEHAADAELLRLQWAGPAAGLRLFQSVAGWLEESLHPAPVDSQR